MYFWLHNTLKPSYTKINLMGIIAFWKSFLKHLRRGSPHWIIKNQLKGMLMCARQLWRIMKTRPEILDSTTTCVPTGYGKLYVTITELDSKPFEVFCSLGKSGSSIMAKAELTGRMTSLALRNGVDIKEIVNQLIDIDGGNPVMWEDILVKSIPDAVAKVLEKRYLMKGEEDA